MAKALLDQSVESLRDRVKRYGLSEELLAGALELPVHEVSACLHGKAIMPLRLRLFLSMFGAASTDSKRAVIRAIMAAAKISPREWREVSGFSAYEVSNVGDVRRNGILLNPVIQKHGHKKVSLYNGTKRGMTFGVHQLVARAFNGPPPPGKPLACHLNGSPADNRPDNLYWGNSFDNARDTVKHAAQRRANVEGSWRRRAPKNALCKICNPNNELAE